jgi:PAS domain S-box-containing protein
MARRAGEALSTRASVSGDLAAACDALWSGLLLVNAKGEVVYANGAAAAFLGKARENIVGQAFASFVQSEPVRQAVMDAAAGKLRTRASIEVKSEGTEGGEGPKLANEERRGDKAPGRSGVLRFSVRPVRREDQAAVIIVIEDVTQQRVADEARNAFVAHATHELRTPLTNIRLYTEQMIDEGENDAKVREKCLNVISQESRRLERIIGDMLSVSEIEAGALKLRTGDVRFETLFKELEDDFRPQAQAKEITLKFDLPPKMPVIKGDRDKIVLAIYNLVANAIKYTPSGGQVVVRLSETGEGVSIDVQDNGIGIKPEECEKVFERFYRSTDKRITNVEGTGLGLTLAREVVRLHGGDITVDSRIDKGSTFQIRIPTKAAA